ncbi:hypothetical protein DKX38_010271 [Salix brachista]|uniref:TLDc domain-containing protein n=1 Tax=Salix brachista TaxID=2182728 RepID=A0A5N5MCQ2_9ROSI|nr:hypothetical protein DKX38_010271 [Salix brachista]
MGNSQSPPADPRFSSATRAFTQKDLEDLNSLFVSLAAQSKSNNEYVSLSVFQAYFGLKGSLGERLFDLVTQQRKDNKLTFHDLVIAKSVYEKGTRDDIEEFIYQLLDVTGDGVVGRCDIESVLAAIFWNIFSLEASNPGLNTHPEIINEFLNAAIFSKAVEGAAEKSMSFEDFRSWCALLPSVRKFLGSLLIQPDAGRPGSQVPQLMHGDNINPDLILLREEYAWHIGGALPHHELEEWKLLYHSAINGMSFNTFLGSTSYLLLADSIQRPEELYSLSFLKGDNNILCLAEFSWCLDVLLAPFFPTGKQNSVKDRNGEGPTILIIKDKDGYIYGGYASQPWERHGNFYGDLKSFLFQLYPKASIFKPTGANNNVQWDHSHCVYVLILPVDFPSALVNGRWMKRLKSISFLFFQLGERSASSIGTGIGDPGFSSGLAFGVFSKRERFVLIWAVLSGGDSSQIEACAANFSSESIPNGIGFGGRVNHFGLFLSASFDVGQTFTCTTFGSPCLSKTNRIFPEVIECWGIIQNVAQKEKLDAIKGTVLERFKEERHMLNMVGLANSSE